MATKATTLFGLTAVKAWLKVTDDSQDALITQIADAVSERIEAVTRRFFVTGSIVDVQDGDGSRQLLLSKFPVAAFTTLTIAADAGSTPAAFELGTDFDLDSVAGRLRMRTQRLTRGFQNVSASYAAGWGAQDALTLPQDVYQAGLDYVKSVYSEYDANAIAATSVALGPSTFVLKPGLPYGIKSVLDQWRAVRL